jgi:hypothetical protein
VWFNQAEDNEAVEALSQEGNVLLRRIRREGSRGDPRTSMTMLVASERPAPQSLNGLAREYELAEYLDQNWRFSRQSSYNKTVKRL